MLPWQFTDIVVVELKFTVTMLHQPSYTGSYVIGVQPVMKTNSLQDYNTSTMCQYIHNLNIKLESCKAVECSRIAASISQNTNSHLLTCLYSIITFFTYYYYIQCWCRFNQPSFQRITPWSIRKPFGYRKNTLDMPFMLRISRAKQKCEIKVRILVYHVVGIAWFEFDKIKGANISGSQVRGFYSSRFCTGWFPSNNVKALNNQFQQQYYINVLANKYCIGTNQQIN